MVCNGKTKQHRQIRCSGVPVCFGVLGCSSVPVFLVLVHAVYSGCETRKRSSRIPVFLCNRHTGVIEHARHPLPVDVKGGGGGGGGGGGETAAQNKVLGKCYFRFFA